MLQVMHLKEPILPTAKPRITITLTEHQHAVLSSLSHLQKASMSSIVVDLVDTTLPVLERLVGVLDTAANAPKHVLEEIRKSVEDAESNTFGYRVTGLLEELLHRSADEAATATGGRRAALSADEPPTSNRGVRITSPRPKIGSISPMKKGEKNGRVQK